MDKAIKEVTKEFFAKMLVFDIEIEVKEIENTYEINVNCQEPGMLIGKNGETMRAMEQILRLLINKKMEQSVSLSLDIAGYKSKRRQEIEDMAISAADSTVRSNKVQLLIPMSAYDRRIVHLALSKRDDIETESVGEEPSRRVMIKVKKKELV